MTTKLTESSLAVRVLTDALMDYGQDLTQSIDVEQNLNFHCSATDERLELCRTCMDDQEKAAAGSRDPATVAGVVCARSCGGCYVENVNMSQRSNFDWSASMSQIMSVKLETAITNAMNSNVASSGSFFANSGVSSSQTNRSTAVTDVVNAVKASSLLTSLQAMQIRQRTRIGGFGTTLRNVSIDQTAKDVSTLVLQDKQVSESLVSLENAIRNDTSTLVKAATNNIVKMLMTVILVVVIGFTGLWVFNLFLTTYSVI